MKLTEESLQKMIQNGLSKAFGQNQQYGVDSTDNFMSMTQAKNMVEDELEEKEGVPHYTQNGKEWKGKVHKMPDGSLMSGNPHNVSGSGVDGKSEKLYHKDDLNEYELDEQKGYSPFLKSDENPNGETEGLTTDVLQKIFNKILQDMDDEDVVGGETTEATGAGSAGGFEAPLFSEPKKNTLFQPGTEIKTGTKPEGGPVNEDKIKGGLSDGMDIEDIAEMHNITVDEIFGEFQKGVNIEMEHTSEMMVAVEIALDHLYEDPKYYSKLKTIEGGETTEITGASSAGAYDAPFGGPKKDPLKLSNPKTVEKELRSVRDKNFPKYGGPGAKFVKVKDKCSKFPYCNQGDINALQIFEMDLVKEMVTNTAKKTKVEEYVVRNIIAKELGYIKEQDGEYVSFEFPDDYKPKSAEEHRDEFLNAISDKRASFLLKNYDNKEFEFDQRDLSGKGKITGIGPKGNIGFASSADGYTFDKDNQVEMHIDISELKYKGQTVPVGFYDMISRYLPPEEEEDSYRGNPVEFAVESGLDEIISNLKYMDLYLGKIRINPYSRIR